MFKWARTWLQKKFPSYFSSRQSTFFFDEAKHTFYSHKHEQYFRASNTTWRECATGRHDGHWDVHDKSPLGEGSFGTVNKVLLRLDVLSNKVVHNKDNPPLVIKQQLIRAAGGTFSVKENEMAARIPELCVRKSTNYMVSDVCENYKVTAMRYLEGETLEKIIKKHGQQKHLTGIFLLRLAIATLRAYAKQISANRIVHGDIKPGNMMVNLLRAIDINFFDFSFSHSIEDNQFFNCGTPGFSAPEIYRGSIPTKEGEYFSLGCLLGYIFLSTSSHTRDKSLDEIRKMARNYRFENLFDGLNFSSDHQSKIETALLKMVQFDPKERATDEETLLELEKVLLDFDLEAAPHLQKQIEDAHILGTYFRMALAEHAQEYRTITIEGISSIHRGFQEFMEQMPSDPEALEIFIDRADVHFLRGISSKEEALLAVSQLVAAYQANRDELLACQNKVTSMRHSMPKQTQELDRIQKQIDQALQKANCSLTFDHVLDVSFTMLKRAQIINEQLLELEKNNCLRVGLRH